jgi:hypothetical protein
LLTVILILLIACKSSSQIPQPNTYVTNNYINKFQGIWRWVSGNDTVVLRLGKVQYFYANPPQSSFDVLLGCHTYINNGILIESSMNRYDSVILYNHKRHTLFGWSIDSDTSKVEGTFMDISKHKRGQFFLEYVNAPTPQIIWKLENTKGLVAVPDGTSFDYNFTLPRNMVLTKQ